MRWLLESQWGTRNVNSLTAGDALTLNQGGSPLTCSSNYVTCGNGSGAGTTIVYSLTNTSAGSYNLTNITVYGGWGDAGRDQQAYTVYYANSTAPATFLTLGTVNYNPNDPSNACSAVKVSLMPSSGFLATNVVALKFDFGSAAPENGYCGYAQITASGISVSPSIVADTLPATAVDVVGSSVTFTAGASGSNLFYQWQRLSGGVTNDIAGETNSTVILTNLQLSDAASYQLRATNLYGAAYSTARPLTVNNVPASVNNVITSYAAQTGLGGTTNDFYTTWTVAPGSLIAGMMPSSIGAGNFSDPLANECGTVAVLTDNSFGYIHSVPGNGGGPTEVTCGTAAGGAGQSVTYTLAASANGYNLTNITVYGGWGDAGRDQQAYTISYSKISAPNTFIALGTANFNPPNPSGVQSATRAIHTAAGSFLATNVAAVKFDFTSPSPENGYTGYSEIQVFGVVSLPPVVPVNAGVGLNANNNLILNLDNLVAGRNYTVQSTTNLMPPIVWNSVINFTATASFLSITSSISGATQKFYQVLGY